MARVFAVVAILALMPRPGAAQSCELVPGVAYATYVDRAGATQPLLMDLLIPVGALDPTPVVMWVHGGGWRGGMRAPIPTRAANLCARGYAIASIDYRLSIVAKWPAQIQDAKAAVRWLRAHADVYNLDPTRIAAWGNSAGGHLAAILATSGDVKASTVGTVTVDLEGTIGGNLQHSSRVQAAVAWYPLIDFLQERFYPLTRDPEAASSYEGDLLGGGIQGRAELTATADPITYASADDPPLLTMHGTSDPTSPFNQSELLIDALTDHRVTARLYPVLGAQHAATYFDKTTHLEVVYAFLADALAQPPIVSATSPLPESSPTGIRIDAIDRAAAETGDPGRLRVTRSGTMATSLTVQYTVSGTATHASDYSHLSGAVVIPAGAASATVDVAPLQDDLREGTETVILTLDASSEYELGTARTASIAIADDDNDPARPTVSVSVADRDAAEPGDDAGTFMITRTGSTTGPLTVDIAVGGTAVAGVDFAALPSSVTFPAGVNRLLIHVTPNADSFTEGIEDVTLGIVPNPSIYVGPYARAHVTIADSIATPPSPLPTGWSAADVGSVGVTGSASEANGTFTVSGAGTDVWGTEDGFQFAYRSLTGDGTIVARVASIDATQAWAKMGVMIRTTTAANAAHGFMLVSLGKGLAFQRRTTAGAASVHSSGGSGTAPRWVRLTRSGNVITASVSTDGVAWATVGSDTFVMPQTVLVGVVAHSHDPSRAATATFDHVAITAADTDPTLPAGWQSRDVGAVGVQGSTSESAGTFTVRGAGADVWGTSDAFHFAYRALSGDGVIVARVASISGTQPWTKMGVMIRESLTPDAAHAFMIVSASKGLAFQRRTTAGGISTHTAGGTGTAPRWVKLARTGPVMTAFVSADGAAWTEVGSDTFSMGTDVLVGLAASSHDATQTASARFESVTVTLP